MVLSLIDIQTQPLHRTPRITGVDVCDNFLKGLKTSQMLLF